jgi:aldehyde:ferredoxin oxidoreductase
METYEKGLIDESDTEGLELEFGNEDALIEIIDRIARREGFGDTLARGVKIASEEVGKGSDKWAVQSRGLEQSGVETRGAYSYALAFAVNPRGPDHLHTECLAEFGGTPEAVETVKKITGDKKYATPTTTEKRAEIVRWHEDIYAVTDALGLCAFTTTAAYGIDEEKAAKMFEYKTGIPTSPEEIMKAGKRIVTLERSFNVREGLSRKDDLLPRRMMEEDAGDLPGEDPRISREKLDKMLDRYYELHGWNPDDGKPTEETLNDLNLDFVSTEI